MKNLGVIGKVLKYVGICLALLTPSFLIYGQVFASDSGGYPWAKAEVIDQSTYDWGFRQCQPLVRQNQACTAHTRYKMGVKYYLSDPWRYDVRNCTSYVAWRVNRDYGISIPGWGNASNWDNAAAGRFMVDNTPREGDIAVWEGGYGHVAFVTKVYPNGMFEVDQYNSAGTGQFSHQLRSSAHHFIHVRPANTPLKTAKPTKAKKTNTSQAKPLKLASKKLPKLTDPPTIENTTVPKPGVGDIESSSPLPSTKEVEYLLEYAPNTKQINAFAIRHTRTKSGKIEINQSSLKDRNTKFQKTKISSAAVRAEDQTKFALADHNQDSVLDLYIFKVAGTKSGKTEISVLDGASDYTKQLVNSVSSLPSHSVEDVNYRVADKNNDHRPDIFRITLPNKQHKTKFEVLDGSKQFSSLLNSWETKDNLPRDSRINYSIGDHDGDGKVDVYQSFQAEKDRGQLRVEIYEAKDDMRVASRKLLIGEPSSKPLIILPLIKIEDESV